MNNWDVEAQNIEQRRKYADLLRSQSMEPIDSGQLPGVPVSPFQGLAKIFKAYTSGQAGKKAEEDAKSLVTRRNQALAEALKGAFSPVPGQPEQYGPYQEGLVKPAVPERPRTPQEISQALLANPDTMQLGWQMMIKDVENRSASERSIQDALFKQKLQMDPDYIEAQRKIKASSESPYYTPIYTPEGVMSFNARSGSASPVMVNGKPVVGANFDPNLQRTLAGAKESGKTEGEMRTKAALDLPSTIASTEQTIGLIDSLVNHPGMSTVVGAPGISGIPAKMGAPIPGTAAADFTARLDQLAGKQFLEAYNTLKGGGQITEVEGKKATEAMSRLTKTGQSEAAYRQAADELKSILRLGVERARQKAGATTNGPSPSKRIKLGDMP